MLNHPACAQSVPTPAGKHDPDSARGEFDEILTLAREAGMLITLDGQIGREVPEHRRVHHIVQAFRRSPSHDPALLS